MLDPPLVLLDEPSMGLDPKTLKLLFETITRMHQNGRTILLVEQNARTGLGISTHGVVMESGKVRLTGTHTEILNNPEISHLYLGGTLSDSRT
jgi:branched-chain amino acid transport system ATP-binding protein